MQDRNTIHSIPFFRRILLTSGKILLFVGLSGIFIFLFSIPLVALVPADQAEAMAAGDMSRTEAWVLNLTYLMVTAGVFLALWIVRRLISKQPLVSAGLGLKNGVREFGEGWLLGMLMVTFGYLLLLLTGMASSTGWHFAFGTFLGWLVLFLLQPFFEELVFRGYLMSILGRYFNLSVALILSSLVFALVHAWNDGFTSLGFVTISLAGLLFGLLFMKTGRIWLPTGLHAAWNFTQGVIFGFPTSGIRTYSLTETTTSGPDWLSGGAFGFEGSVLAVLLIVAAIWWYRGSYRQEQLSDVMYLRVQPATVLPEAPIAEDQSE